MTTAYWRDFWGTAKRRTNPYGTPGSRSVYTKGYHRGEDIANYGATADVPALRAGEIIDHGRSTMIGYWVCVRPDADPSKRDIYCHMYEKTVQKSGRVDQGEIFGRTAGYRENPGKGWIGPHLHFVVSNLSDGGHNTARADYDPRPIISSALAGSAGSPASNGSTAALKPSQKVLRVASNRRKTPTKSGTIVKVHKKGEKLTVDTYKTSERVTVNGVTSAVWFGIKGTGSYIAAACFTDQSTAGLKNNGTYAPAPAKVKKRYVRLSKSWYYYTSEANAKTGRGYSVLRMLRKGDYEIVDQGSDKASPYQVWTSAKKTKKVWIGTAKTAPLVVSK